MKNYLFTISLLILLLQFSTAQDVGINTANPHASAILDINSFQKGMLVPRMLQPEREAITNPAVGLLVYQTNGQTGFYYYQSSSLGWKIFSTNSMLTDGDNNTKVHTEKNTDDDMVRGEIDGVEYWNLQTNSTNKVRMEIISNENISIGDSSGMITTTGKRNIAYGKNALKKNTIGNDNIGIGNRALFNSKSDQNIAIGNETMTYDSSFLDGGVAIGHHAGQTSSAEYGVSIGHDAASQNYGGGDFQIAIGKNAMYNANTASGNIGIGSQALFNTTHSNPAFPVGFRDIGIGYKSLYNNIDNDYLIGIGSEAGNQGEYSLAVGYKSLSANTSIYHIGIGSNALQKINSGENNAAIGYNAGLNLLSGSENSVMGSNALSMITGNNKNTAFGSNAQNQTVGQYNTSMGYNALSASFSGEYNTAFGANAMSSNAGLSDNIAVGYNSNIAPGVTTAIALGANAYAGTDNCLILGSVAGVNGASTTAQVGIGTSSPHESAILDLHSDQWVFGLSTAAAESNILNPTEGLMFYSNSLFRNFS